jgi:hypothetical protein
LAAAVAEDFMEEEVVAFMAVAAVACAWAVECPAVAVCGPEVVEWLVCLVIWAAATLVVAARDHRHR